MNKNSAISFRDLIKISLSILKETPEVWLNFSAGQNTNANLSRTIEPPRIRGLLSRTLIYIRWLALSSKLTFAKTKGATACQKYLFADSINQLTVLTPLVKVLSARGLHHQAFVDLKSKSSPDIDAVWNPTRFNLRVILASIALLTIRFKRLHKELKAKDARLLAWRLDSFLKIYTWLPYFLHQISLFQPEIVIVGNDHNPSTRSLIAVCRILSVRTAYLQHASVSKRFHELQFTYSFLDGEESYKTYLSCEGRRAPSSHPKQDRSVFLTGIKRQLTFHKDDKDRLGIAFKEADGYDNLHSLVMELSREHPSISIRCHPATSKNVINKIQNNILRNDIILSDPREISVDSYCRNLFCLLAGNSSILIEAAICGVPSIYYEMGLQYAPDYYSFVKNQVCHSASDLSELRSVLIKIKSKELRIKQSAVKRYSESFGTIWQGKEAELVANHIETLLQEESPTQLWGYRELPPYT